MTTFPTRDPEKLQDIIIEWLNWKAQRCLAEIGPLTSPDHAQTLRDQAGAFHMAADELGAVALPPKPPGAEPAPSAGFPAGPAVPREPFAPPLRNPEWPDNPGGPNGSSAVPR